MKSLAAKFTGSTKKISIGIAVIRLVRAIMTAMTLVVAARYFGVSAERDAWVLCTAFTMVILQLLFGPINEVFRTKCIHIRVEQGNAVLGQTNASICSFYLWISVLAVLVIELKPELVCNMIAQNLTGVDRHNFIFYVRLIIPSLVLTQLVNGWTSILNCQNVFFIPELYGIVISIFNVIFIVALADYLGVGSLILAMYVGNFVLLLLLVREIRKWQPSPIISLLPNITLCWTLLVSALPFYLPYFFGQLVSLIEKRISMGLGVGNASILDYAQKLVQVPQGVIMGTIATVLAPALAAKFSNNQTQHIQDDVCEYLRMIFLGMIPVVVILAVCSEDLIDLFFAHKITIVERIIMAKVTRILTIGLFGVVVYSVAGQALVAQKKGKLYAGIAVLIQIIIVTLNLVWGNMYGLIFMATAWAVTHIVLGIVLLLFIGISMPVLLNRLGLILLILGSGLFVSEYIHSMLATNISIINILISEITAIVCVISGLRFTRQPEFVAINNMIMRLKNN